MLTAACVSPAVADSRGDQSVAAAADGQGGVVVSTQTQGGTPPAPGATPTGGGPAAGPAAPAVPVVPTTALTAGCNALGPTTTGPCAPPPPAGAPAAAPAPPDGFVVAVVAREQLVLPLPDVRTAPPPGVDQLVGLATWLWIDPAQWHGLSKSVLIPGVAATVTARPTSITWQTGDGRTVRCNGPGTPYNAAVPDENQSSNCTHTYLDRGPVTARVTVHWQMDWSATTGQAGTFGLVDRTTAVPLTVAEVQAVTN